MNLFATFTLYHLENGRTVLHAMPVMIGVLAVFAIAYGVYSRFLAYRVARLDPSRVTPAVRLNDGQNYHPTNKWVAFGHHFAAISGAGPLIGPVLAIQYGYAPGLIWLVVGVCLAGAVQDMLVLAASVRRDGKSLAEIARHELGRPAAVVVSLAILVIVVIALAGLGIIVVKAIGGDDAKLPTTMTVQRPKDTSVTTGRAKSGKATVYQFPAGCKVRYSGTLPETVRSESFKVTVPDAAVERTVNVYGGVLGGGSTVALQPLLGAEDTDLESNPRVVLPVGCTQSVPGSSWGTFTIFCTIPIAILIGVIIRFFKGAGVLVGSLLGGVLTLGAVVAGNWIPGSPLEPYFSLNREETVIALSVYGFIAAVLPVWFLLGPRDYLSSFLKIGTVGLLIVSVCVANPPLQAPEVNETFMNGSPVFPTGHLFPFVFICIMCGAVSGFHSLVSSGTTPKMITNEKYVRPIGYGAMLMESIVGVTALVAAACLPPQLYYDINVPIEATSKYQTQVQEIDAKYGVPKEANDPLHATNVDSVGHLDLGRVEERVGGESLRGRTGGAVTLAVGMSVILEDAGKSVGITAEWLLKYWYHFAIMFEALFILTTIDAGTRIGRFLLQETVGRVWAPFARPDWLPGSIIASAVITGGWGWLIQTESIETIWPMFGIANQLLAVLALALVTTWLVNTRRAKYAWVTLLPMAFVVSTTMTAGVEMIQVFIMMINSGKETKGVLNIALIVFVMASVGAVLILSAVRWVGVVFKFVPTRRE